MTSTHPTPSVAIATCDALLPLGDAGDAPLLAALRERGAEVSVVSWSDPVVDWASFDLTVIRSTWDYTARREEFLAWLDRVPRLHNPAAVVRSNSDKTYLRELAAAGLPVVATAFAAPGEPVVLPEAGEYVVKPSVGAGSRGAGRFDAGVDGERDRAAAHAARLHDAGRTVLVQPYLAGVDVHGETVLVYLDGTFSHSIRKGRMLPEGIAFDAHAPGLFIEEDIQERTPSAHELAVGATILAELAPGEPLLYARIDLLPGADGPVLVEAELTEPSLFLEYATGAAEVLAEAILRRAAVST